MFRVHAYAIADIRVHDPALFSRYVEQVGEIVRKHQGRYLSRAGKVTCITGAWKPGRIVLIEFPSREELVRCFASREYREILPIREGSSTGSLIMVEESGEEETSPSPETAED